MQPQPFVNVLSLPVSIVSSYNRDYTVHKAYNIFYPAFCQKKVCWLLSSRDRKPQGTVMERQCKAVRGEKQSMWDGKRGAERGCWEEGVGEAGVQRRTMGCIERGAGQQNHLRGRSGLRRQHIPSLKSLSETYRPECKSWHVSNTSWNLCSALYARMVQSPRREDAKWENTGLRAGEADRHTTEKVRETGCEETHCLLGFMVTCPAKGHTCGFLVGCLGEEVQHPFWRGFSMWSLNSCSHQPSL